MELNKHGVGRVFGALGWVVRRTRKKSRVRKLGSLLSGTVLLLAQVVITTTSAHAYYWQATFNPATCKDGVTCALISFWSFAVNQGYQGPLTCTEGFDVAGQLTIVGCAPVGSHTSGYATLNCEGEEKDTAAGCFIPRGKDPSTPPVPPSPPTGCPLTHPASVPSVPTSVGDATDGKSGVLTETLVDYSTQGPHPLALTRTYWSDLSSMIRGNYSRLGTGWSTNFDSAISFNGDPTNNPSNIYVRLPDGRDIQFNSSNGSYVNANTTKETVSYAGGGSWIVNDDNGVNYTYNSSAQLTQIQYQDGYTETLAWSAGLNTRVTDSYHRSLQFSYNATGLLTQVTTSDNKTLSYSYTQVTGTATYPGVTISVPPTNFALQTVTYPDSTSVFYQYGNSSFPFALTGMTDERGIQIDTWTWTSDGRVQQNSQAGNVGTYTFSYDDADSQTTVTNPLGKNTIYHYNAAALPSLLTQVEGVPSAHCPGANTTYQYDGNYNINQATDGEGRVTTYTSEARGLPTSITRAYGTPSASTTTITWNPTWRVPNEVVQPGLTTDYTWNTSGQLTQLTETDTTSQSVPYSSNGQTRTWTYSYTGLDLTSVTGPTAGQTTTYAYDGNGFLQSVTNAQGQITKIVSVNGRGEPTLVTDAKGVNTALTYDLRGRLTGVSVDTANTPAVTTIAYTPAGDVASITDPIGGSQAFTYDSARRLTGVLNSAGENVTYARDAMGNATSVTIANGQTTTTYSKTQAFDELGRLIQMVGAVPANSNYQFAYDKTDNLVSVTDPRSYTFSYGFDALNRLIQETDEENHSVTLTRNGIDAITAYEDSRSLVTNYVRNGFGEIIQEASPDKGTAVYVRNANGNVTQRTDARGLVPGISDLPLSDSRIFDNKGNVTRYSRTVSSTPAFSSSYTYDLDGNVTSLTYPSGRIVNFQRDSLGRVTNIATLQNGTSPMQQTIASSIGWVPYSGIGALTFGNGIVETFSRDTDNRIIGVVATTPSATILNRSLSWTGETLDAIADHQFPGNTPPFTYSAQSQTFTYTPTHRVAGVVGYYGTYGWTYDPNGNRATEAADGVTSTYAYPTTSNQLTSVTPTGGAARGFTYDAEGDVVTDSGAGSSPAMTFQYDSEGRLAKAFQTATPAENATYTYDAQSRLSSRTVNHASASSATTLYAYDTDDHIIAELNTSGQTLREYIWLNDMPVAVVDNVNTMPVIYYVQTDHLMRPARMTDQNAHLVWDVIYDPFGATAFINQNPAEMDIRFPGQWFQLETGLAYNWHRHYDATTGRYVQPDPLLDDNGYSSIKGISTNASPKGGNRDLAAAHDAGWISAEIAIPGSLYRWQAFLPNGPNLYNYAGQSPMVAEDRNGLAVNGPFSPIPTSNNILQCEASLCDALGKVGDLCIYICPNEGNGFRTIYSPLGLSCPKFAVTSNPNVKPWGPPMY